MSIKSRLLQLEKRKDQAKSDVPMYQVLADDGSALVTFKSGRKARTDQAQACKTYIGCSPDDWDK